MISWAESIIHANVFSEKGGKKKHISLDIRGSVWYNTTMNNEQNSQAYQVNVHALYDRNSTYLTPLAKLRRQKKISLKMKKNEKSLDIVQSVWYNTTINNKER